MVQGSLHTNITGQGRGDLLKFRLILSFDIAEPEHDNQTALSPITVTENRLNSKTIFAIKNILILIMIYSVQ